MRLSLKRRLLVGGAALFVACAAFNLLGRADENVGTEKNPPTIVLDDVIAIPGRPFCGYVVDDSPGVRVDASIVGGRPLPGSPDTNSNGTHNGFCFPIPAVPGTLLSITATDANFNQSTVIIPVQFY
jgi:hypothetical protein